MSDRLRSLTGSQITLLVAVVSGLLAGLARLPWLASSPSGFSLAEARSALYAHSLSPSDLLRAETGHLDSQEPFFSGMLRLTGSLAGWDIGGARLAAALLGIVAAVACALWYRRAIGPFAGMLGGLLVATTFPWLVLSRQAQPAIGAAALAALGLYCLWEGLGPRLPSDNEPTSARSHWWIVAAGLLFGLGFAAHPSFLPALLIVPASAIVLARQPSEHPDVRPRRNWLIAGLVCLLLGAAPTIITGLSDPSSLRQHIEQDWNGDGQPDQIAGPIASISGYSETIFALGWRGSDNPTLGTPGRALLDPALFMLWLVGLVVILRHPRRPLHSLALLWLVGFGIPAAILDPGNPALLMPLTPILFLLPLLGIRACLIYSANRGQRTLRLATWLALTAIIASVCLSLLAYREWTNSDQTFIAFNADLVEAIAAIEQLAPDSTPVYIATTPDNDPLLDYLALSPSPPDRIQRTIDSRTTLVVPTDGIGYMLTTISSPPPANLLQLLDTNPPAATGSTPDGNIAWQIWTSGQSVREQLPWTLPAFTFPDGFVLVGFAIQPDFGDVKQSGRLPDPPRVLVTLVWNAPRGATPHISRVHLFPDDPDPLNPVEATTAEASLTTSPPIAAGNRGREYIVVQLSVPVPETPNLVVDVQVSLHRDDGTILPPLDAGASAAGDNVRLNRVQYVPNSAPTP